MDKKTALILGLVLVLVIISLITRSTLRKASTSPEIAKVKIGKNEYSVEVVKTPAEHAQGLSGRDYLSEKSGMLFVFERPQIQAFWMNGMKFPLDIIWINGFKVIGFEEGAAVPIDGQLPVYRSPQAADMVLELVAGTVLRDEIQIGDIIEVKSE